MKNINNNHPGGMLTGISTLFRNNETPDKSFPGWTNMLKLSFPKSVIGNLNLRKTKAAEVPNNNFRIRQYCSAFTLIELLVVVLIIGILAAIALPQYKIAVMKSRLATIMTNVKAIVNSSEIYYLTNGQYPDDDDIRDIDIGIAGCYINPNTEKYFGTFHCPTEEYDFGYSNQDQMLIAFLKNQTEDMFSGQDYVGIAYAQYPQHALPVAKRGTQECWADITNTTANKVCLSLGGVQYETLTWRGIDWNKYKLP